MNVRDPTKAVLQNLANKEKISVPYNPTEYTRIRKLIMCTSSAGVQFQTVVEPEFTVNLFFDTYEDRTDVRDLTGKIAALQEPTQGAGAKRDPPKVLFSWGQFQYTGVLSNFQQRFTLFLDTGVPVRAEVSITLTNAPTVQQVIEDAGLDNCRKLHVVKSSDRLDVLAYSQTGDASNWRDIAAANDIENPLAFPTIGDVGRTLIIPDYHG
jgi:hypothetical protein